MQRRLWPAALSFLLLALPLTAATAEDFFAAIRNDDAGKVRALLADPSNLKLADSKGVTALLYASAFGNFDTMKLLVGAGADVNGKDLLDDAPLHWSACDPARVKLLVEHGAEVNAKTKGGRTPLIIASSCEAASDAVRLLIDKGADVNAQPPDGSTPLMEASRSGGSRIARMLLAAGAKADITVLGGYTALMTAVNFNDVDLVRALIVKGAPVNSKNTFSGRVRNGDIDLKSLTALMLAAPYGSPELIQVLLDAGADVKAKDGRGMTPLMFAVAGDGQNVKVAKLLIERGSDVNATSKTGETVLDWARKFQSPPVLALLEKAGAKGNPLPAAPARKEAPLRDARAAAAMSVSLLQKKSQEFFKQSGCVGCHHQPVMTLAVKSAREAGIAVDEKDLAEQRKAMAVLMSPRPIALLVMQPPPGGLDTVSFSLLGLAAAGHDADLMTDSTVAFVAARQRGHGGWGESFGNSRAPMEESAITQTVICLRTLQTYTIPARKAEFEQRVLRARAWLLEAKPRTAYERAERLLGLHWAGASPEQLKTAAKALLHNQQSDGGWAQREHLASDAYATGLAMRALRESKQLRGSDAAYRKGVDYLLRTQMEDGSWYVRSRAMKLQPYFQSGFPYDHDQWISYTATAYATVALAGAEEPSTVRASR